MNVDSDDHFQPGAFVRSTRKRRILLASAVAAICFVVYLANGRTLEIRQGFDTIPNRLLPFSILGYGTVTADPFRDDFQSIGGFRGYFQERRGSLVSFYPIGTVWVALPYYLPSYLYLEATGRTTHDRLFRASEPAEKFAASAIAATAVAILFLLLSRTSGQGTSLVVALAFGLGTLMWAVASQALWQHGPAVLCLLLGLSFLMASRSGFRVFAAGFFLGVMFSVRPPTVPFLLAGVLCLILTERTLTLIRHCALFGTGVLLSVLPTLINNCYYYGNLTGGYSAVSAQFRADRILEGLTGLLLSPNRGLLVFTPLVIPGFVGCAVAMASPRKHPALFAFSWAAAFYLIFHASFYTWAGGWTFGPRYTIEILPVLALASTLTARWMGRRSVRLVVAALFLWSLLVQVNGAIMYPASSWNARMSPDMEAAAWNFEHILLWEDFKAWLDLQSR